MERFDMVERTGIGSTGLRVSKICFGTSALGNMPDTYGYSVGEEQAARTLEAIFDSAINFLDTSRNYGMGRSEEQIGDAIRARGGLPAGFVLSTKLDRDMASNRFDAGRARKSLEESLDALGLDRIPLLHLHDPEHSASIEEITGPNGALSELFRFRDEGLAGAVGLAAGKVDVMMPILRDWDFDALITHNRFTLVNRNADSMIDFAHSRGVAVLNAAPYNGGVFAKGTADYPRFAYQEAGEAMLDPVRQVEAVCARHSIPPGAAALQFSLRDPRITATICGVSKAQRVQQTIDWAKWPISDDVWQELLDLPFTTDDPEATRVYNPG